jgi:hypothetical protein
MFKNEFLGFGCLKSAEIQPFSAIFSKIQPFSAKFS